MIELWRIILVLAGTVVGSFGALFLKLGSKHFTLNFKKLITNYKLSIGILFYGLAIPPFIIAIKGAELSTPAFGINAAIIVR